MKILIIGTGYVGTTTGLVFAELGHQVTGLDLDKNKVRRLNRGELPFYEPGLEELLLKHLQKNNISFLADTKTAIEQNDIIFICVGTPSNEDGSADLTYVEQVAKSIGKYMNGEKLIVMKSTVPLGTSVKVKQWVAGSQRTLIPFDVVSNPEFLREGSALKDSLQPDRIVIGTTNVKSAQTLKELYKELNSPYLITTPPTAELIKYTANSFLALKISFMNELARLCDCLELNIKDIADGIGLDPRIGPHFLQAGIGYGGSCFPKDIKALLDLANKMKSPLNIVEEVVKVNDSQPIYYLRSLEKHLGPFQDKLTIGIWGLSFKPNTDDIREAPAMKIMDYLLSKGVKLKVHDPIVRLPMENSCVKQCFTAEEAIEGCDALIICTEWEEYREKNWSYMKEKMKSAIVLDGRNILSPNIMTNLGFRYFGIGNTAKKEAESL